MAISRRPDGHPIYETTTASWVDAGDLLPGDTLDPLDGSDVAVTSVRYETRNAVVYNLTVEAAHTYHAGNNELLVHNCEIPGQPRDARGRFTSGAGGESPAAAAGRSAHVNYEHTLGGGDYAFNTAMPGSRLRPDAVDHSQRVVRELKPDTPRAISAGRRQVNRYKAYLEGMTGESWTAHVDVYRR